MLCKQLTHLDAVNIGAAGTFVVRRPVARARLHAELASRLPFETEIVICEGRDILGLMSANHFAGQPIKPDIVRFVSVLSRRARSAPSMPVSLPSGGPWLLKLLARDHQFIVGQYRRHMKVIGLLGKFDGLFGVPVTTRNWNTMTAIAKVLGQSPHDMETTMATTDSPDELPARIGRPALRALKGAGIHTLTQVAQRTEASLAALHGVGPKALGILKKSLAQRGTSFRAE
jgi:hypothetical protein